MAFTATRDRSNASIRWSRADVLGLVSLMVLALLLSLPSSWRDAALDLVTPRPSSAQAAPAETAGGLLTGPARVIDGDTLDMAGQRIRLHGVDAFERDQTCGAGASAWPCGRMAAETLSRRLDGRTVACEPLDTDRYGRTVARCRTGGEDLGAFLVDRGLAVAYRRYSDDYVAAEDTARASRIGVWRAPSFTGPAEWRAERR
jgi:endonuclease YncB( thermonuclease family)